MSALREKLAPLAKPGSPEPGTTIPAPPFNWRTRLLVPALVLGVAALVLIISGWRSLVRATPVQVMPVISKGQPAPDAAGTSAQEPAAASGHASVQAPGWIEPDPFPAY